MHHRWRELAIDACSMPPSGGRALDVCAGTADFGIAFARRGHSCDGVDLAAPMVYRGLAKAAEVGVRSRVRLLLGAAEALPMASGVYDAATMGFGLRNVGDIDASFREMARAVRPGGRVVNLEIAKPRWPLYRQLFLLYFYFLSPWLARLCGGDADAYTYLPGSLRRFWSREQIADSMRRAGLTEVHWRDLAGGAVALHIGVRPTEERQ
jgi:demethylmenaquinone methyltransferase/2-methoxy-6-polyprenyl-1,4-benzoquinol methylase